MVIKDIRVVFLCAFCCFPSFVLADESAESKNDGIYEIRYNWHNEETDYIQPFEATKPTEIEAENIINANKVALIDDNESEYKPKAKSKQDFADELLDKLPYKNTLKHTWNVIDGDVDLIGVEGLRFDRGNTGVMYKTSTIPFMGEVDGMEIEFCAGEDHEINFESSVVPFVGKVDGFQMKSSIKEDNSRVYVSYTYSFD